MNAWTPDGAPFCWQPKEAFERIEQSLEREQAASSKLVYLALTRIASNEGTSVFTKPINYVATMASLSGRTVMRRLPNLEKLGLVTVERHEQFRTQHRYRVVTLSRNNTTQSRNVVTRMRPLAVTLNKEVQQQQQQQPSKEITPEWLAGISEEKAYEHLGIEVELSKAKRWCIEHPGRKCTRKFFVNWLNRCRPETITITSTTPQLMTRDEALRQAL